MGCFAKSLTHCGLGSVILKRYEVVTSRLANGIAAFIWKLRWHWLKGLPVRRRSPADVYISMRLVILIRARSYIHIILCSSVIRVMAWRILTHPKWSRMKGASCVFRDFSVGYPFKHLLNNAVDRNVICLIMLGRKKRHYITTFSIYEFRLKFGSYDIALPTKISVSENLNRIWDPVVSCPGTDFYRFILTRFVLTDELGHILP